MPYVRIEILTASGPVVVDGTRVVIRAVARSNQGTAPLTPVAVAVEAQPGVVIASAAGDPQFQEVLQALRIADTVLVTTPAILTGGIRAS